MLKEIDRRLFVTLNKEEGHYMYYILNDQNYVDKFFAESDDKAKEIFAKMYDERR